MKLNNNVYLCHHCAELFERARYGVCPACKSENIDSLSWLLADPQDRQQWLERIGRIQRPPVVQSPKPHRAVLKLSQKEVVGYLTDFRE